MNNLQSYLPKRIRHYLYNRAYFKYGKKIIGIYKITTPSNRIYIGQSHDIILRWHHYKILQNSRQVKLYASFLKYGVDNHVFEVLKECKTNQLNKLEKYYVDLFKTFRTKKGLNLRDGGGNRAVFKKYPKNIIIKCVCNCGKDIYKYDKSHRPRKYIAGHNVPPSKIKILIISKINNGSKTIIQLCKDTGKSKTLIKSYLHQLYKSKKIIRVKKGECAPIGTPIYKNKIIKCACGCGGKFYKHDKGFRIRKFISGHNMKNNNK